MTNPADAKFNTHTDSKILFEFDLYTIGASNNQLQIVEAVAGDIDITIASGTYTGDRLAALIQAGLNGASALTYSVRFDPVNHYFIIKETTAVFSIDVSDGDMSATIGFTGDQTSSGANPTDSIISDHAGLPGSDSIYIATDAITAGTGNDFDTNGTNINYTDELESTLIGNIAHSCSEIGGLSSTANLALNILNQELRSDFLNTFGDILNAPVTVFGILYDGTDLAWDEKFLLFSGVMNSPAIDENNLTIPLNDARKKLDRLLPSTIIDDTTYPRAERAAIGRPLQFVFGDFTSAGDRGAGVINTYKTLLPAFPSVGLIDKNISRFVLADHVLNDFSFGDSGLVWAQGLDVYIQLTNFNQSLTAPPYLDYVGGPMKGKLRVHPLERHGQDPADISDAEVAKMIDDDSATFGTMTATVGGGKALFQKLRNAPQPGTIEISNIFINVEYGACSTTGTTFRVVAIDDVGTITDMYGSPLTDTSANGTLASHEWVGATRPTTWEDFIKYGFGFVLSASNYNITVENIYIVVESMIIVRTSADNTQRFSNRSFDPNNIIRGDIV